VAKIYKRLVLAAWVLFGSQFSLSCLLGEFGGLGAGRLRLRGVEGHGKVGREAQGEEIVGYSITFCAGIFRANCSSREIQICSRK
jgi:hypothetical protein